MFYHNLCVLVLVFFTAPPPYVYLTVTFLLFSCLFLYLTVTFLPFSSVPSYLHLRSFHQNHKPRLSLLILLLSPTPQVSYKIKTTYLFHALI